MVSAIAFFVQSGPLGKTALNFRNPISAEELFEETLNPILEPLEAVHSQTVTEPNWGHAGISILILLQKVPNSASSWA